MLQTARQNTIKEQELHLDLAVLIVDDDRFLVDTFQLIMEDAGLAVETAVNGEEALEKAAKRKFQLAVVDLNLPDTTGEELSEKLKEMIPGISVMLLTGDTEAGKKPASKTDEVLVKPVDPEELLRFTRIRGENL